MGRVTDETGNRYGRLTVVRRDPENAYHKGANWICRCDCGGERVASGVGLRRGMVKSCGCLARERRVLRCACGYKGQKTPNWTPDWKCFRCSGLSPLAEPPKMTEDELFEKRVEHWRYYHRSAPTSASHDVMLFLERLEKVTKERDMAIEQHRHSQHEVARWVDRETKAARERDEAREELEEARARNADMRAMLEQVTRERDEARRARDQYLRERDLALRAEERWRESLEALEEAIDDCLPGDDDDAPIDCVERAGDKLRELARERDEARASLAQIRRVFGNAIAFDDARGDIVKMAEIAYRGACDGDKAVGQLRDMTRQRDEARAEVERLQETKDYLRTWLSSEELEGLRVKAAEHPLLWEEIHHWKAEVERLRAEADRWKGLCNVFRERDWPKAFQATVTSLEQEVSDAHEQLAKLRKLSKPWEGDAYRRGAEAMREACQQWFREHDESFELTVDACHDVIADMPIPEEP